jgi:hypothetical protein
MAKKLGPFSSQLTRDEAADYDAALANPPDPTEKKDTSRSDAIVKRALARFRMVVEIEGDQRDREVEDLRFDRALPEDQWPEDMRKARAKGIAPDGSVIPERPCLVIPKLDQPVQQTINEARKARLGVVIKPRGAKANKAGAEVRQGMIRTIEHDSRANLARIWALERASKCGRGWYRILKTYANDGDFDLDLVVARIKNQGSVYADPNAQEPDWSDAEFAIITSDMPTDEYRREYGKSAMAAMSAEELQSVCDVSPGWVTTGSGDDGTGTIRIAEYFWAEYEARTLILDPASGESRLLKKGEQEPAGVEVRRTVQKRQIKWAVINAVEVLDEEDWEGRYIPLVPVVGKEYNVDGESCWKGIVSNAKDAQRLYNYARSSQALRSGLESLAPWVMAEGQDEGYEAMWDEANTRAFTRLKYKPTTFEGHLVPPPQRNDLSSTNLSASVLLAREADMDIQATTHRFNPSLGKQDSTNRSGKAVQKLQEQGQQSASNYLENLAYISMVHEGRILLDLLPIVYDRPGRVVRLLGDDPKDERQVVLQRPFIPGPDGPLLTEPGTEGLIPTVMKKLRGKKPVKPILYDLREGDYTVSVNVGQAFATQQEADAAFVEGAMKAAPSLVPYLLDIYAELTGGTIGDRVAKRLQKVNPQLRDEEEESEQEIPPQVQQQLQMQAQQITVLQQELAKAKSGLPAEELRVASNERIKRLEIESRERIEAAKIRASATETSAELGSKEGIAVLNAQTKRADSLEERAHDRDMKKKEAAQDDHAAVRDAVLQPPYPPVAAPAEFTPPATSLT